MFDVSVPAYLLKPLVGIDWRECETTADSWIEKSPAHIGSSAQVNTMSKKSFFVS